MTGLEFGLSIAGTALLSGVTGMYLSSLKTDRKLPAINKKIDELKAELRNSLTALRGEVNTELTGIKENMKYAGERLDGINKSMNNGWHCSKHLEIATKVASIETTINNDKWDGKERRRTERP